MIRRLVARNVANLYAAPNTAAELVTQAILGAGAAVERADGDFCFIRTEDRYQGWIRADALVDDWDQSDHFRTTIATLFAEVFSAPDPQSEILTKLVVSTPVTVAHRPEAGEWTPVELPDRRIGYINRVCLNSTHQSGAAPPDLLDQKVRRAIDIGALKEQVLAAIGQQATSVAKRMIGTPYLWGGCTPFGIDCSGFVQLCYRLSGVQLLRDADIQFADRRFAPVEPGKTLEEGLFAPGDLLAFSRRPDREITHIGLALGDGRFIHASGSNGVAIDECLSADYNQTYVGAIRLSPQADWDIAAA